MFYIHHKFDYGNIIKLVFVGEYCENDGNTIKWKSFFDDFKFIIFFFFCENEFYILLE